MIERILDLAEKGGIKPSKMAKDLDLSSGAVSDWKSGRAKPSTDAVIKIAEYFNVTTDWLLLGRESKLRSSNVRGDDSMVREMLPVKAYVDEQGYVCLEQQFALDDPLIITLHPDQLGTVIGWLEKLSFELTDREH